MSRISKDISEYFPPPMQKNRLGVLQSPLLRNWIGWLPLLLLPTIAVAFRQAMASWVLMWALAFALYFGCKWLTWWKCPALQTPIWRHWAYLIAWPGMDAKAFLDPQRRVAKPRLREWIEAVFKTCLGALLVWGITRKVPITHPLLAGWVGLFGCVFLLHFGTFHLLALGWQRFGVDAQPIMRTPILAKSLADFWGARWNSAFNLLVHKLVFRKLFRRIGPIGALLAVFLVSGIIHDFVISVPARAGYGLPTLYFLLQGFGLCLERWNPKLGLFRGFAGRCFTVIVTAAPAVMLFHPPFINNVILPMLRAIGAT
jgi:Membrane bound O-acyl transferase family